MQPYDKAFYRNIQSGSTASAKVVVPIVVELVQPKSVIDIGCGNGDWLAVFSDCGISDFDGVDGDWVRKELLNIPQNRFSAADLKLPYRVDKRYDLAISLEVAEHLPEASARTFVETLASLAPVVMFSAAIPLSNGNSHINEQWPQYWIELFSARNFLAIDCLRKRLWDNISVEWWYAQNLFIFVDRNRLAQYPRLNAEMEKDSQGPLAIVHPRNFLEKSQRARDVRNSLSLKQALKLLPALALRALKNRTHRG